MRQVLPVRVGKIEIVNFGAKTEGWDCKGTLYTCANVICIKLLLTYLLKIAA